MTVFASIHTSMPDSLSDSEVNYHGYHRVPVECEIGSLKMHIFFPEVQEDTMQLMTHVAIGHEESGDGEVLLALECLPHVPLKIMHPGKVPNIIITYPETLAKSARVLHQMVALGRIRTNEIEPRFFEQTNDHLQAHGIPILKVTRSAAAAWKGKINQMPSMNSEAVN